MRSDPLLLGATLSQHPYKPSQIGFFVFNVSYISEIKVANPVSSSDRVMHSVIDFLVGSEGFRER